MPVWRVIFVVAVGLLTSGCLFSAFQIASLTASGISYVVSGRSVGDHALSLAMRQDCATLRILEGDEICVDLPPEYQDSLEAIALGLEFPEYENALEDASDVNVADAVTEVPIVQLADATPETSDPSSFVPVRLAAARADSYELLPEEAPSKPSLAAGLDLDSLMPASGGEAGRSVIRQPRPLPAATRVEEAAPALVARPGTYLVIGSFQNSANAENLGRAHHDLNTAIMTLETGGQTMYRVVAGPIGDGELGDTRARFRQAGIRNTWAVRLCQDNLTLPPCREARLQQAQLPDS